MRALRPSRRVLGGLALAAWASGAAARTVPGGPALPEGEPLPSELVAEAASFPAALTVGNPSGEVTLQVFVDSNCGVCRAADVGVLELARREPELRIHVVNWPVLGLPSVQSARVFYAVMREGGRAAALALHRRIMSARGVVDGPRTLRFAGEAGLDAARIERTADSEEIRLVMRAALAVGEDLGFPATPAYVLGGRGFVGAVSPDALRRMVANVRRCDALRCP